MALQKILARDIVFQIESGTPNTWLAIGGISTTSPNPGEDAEDTDVTDYNSGGRPEYLPTQRGASFGMEGMRLLDSITGDPDPGQGRVDTLSQTLGYPGIGRFRFRHPLETTWTVWNVVCTPGEQGGGNNDAGKWALTLKRSGPGSVVAVV